VLLSIEHTRRWTPIFQTARELIRSGELGPLRVIVAQMYGPRSMLFRNGTHMIDMIAFFAESDPQWVFSELEEGFDHFTEYKSDGGHDPATDPAASAYIHFANGVRAFYNSVKIDMLGSSYELICQDGRVDVSDRGIAITRSLPTRLWSTTNLVPEDYFATHQLGAVTELIDVLERGGELVSPAREARKALEIMLGMLASHQQGSARVTLPLR
jgi:predicted dehydrogenase